MLARWKTLDTYRNQLLDNLNIWRKRPGHVDEN